MVAKPKKAAKWKPPPVVCASLSDADSIFQRWQTIDQEEAEAKLAKQLATKDAAQKFKDALFVFYEPTDEDPTGGKVPFADERLRFEAAIRAYAEKNRDTILLNKLKSRKLHFGELGWHGSPDTIVPYAGVPKEGNPAVLEELQTFVRKSLAQYKELPPVLLDCLTIELAWSRDAINAALAVGKLKKEDLRAIGLRVEAGQDEFFCRPAKSTDASIETAADEE
ncbi:MAG: host-nuclease inhibitor Gam family protein [Patescibacteria group bacterium]|nr:host-nuclease inhibitor Gam family protein [Patescibacteria group bacterium]